MEFINDFVRVFNWDMYVKSLTLGGVLRILSSIILIELAVAFIARTLFPKHNLNAVAATFEILTIKAFWIITLCLSFIVTLLFYYAGVKLGGVTWWNIFNLFF